MYKPRTINQFKVMEFLKENFVTDACLISPISRDGLMLEDRNMDRIGFTCHGDTIAECDIPEPGTRGALRMFAEGLRLAYLRAEQQTFEAKTQQWLKCPGLVTYQQALGLDDDLFRHYLKHPMLSEDDVRHLAALGMVSEDVYRSILLWYLDGHCADNHLCVGGVDSTGTCIDLIFRYRQPSAELLQFYIMD